MRRLLYAAGWTVLTVLAGGAVWWGLRPLLISTAPLLTAPSPSASSSPSVAPPTVIVTPRASPSPGKPPPAVTPGPQASAYDGWAFAGGVFTRTFDVVGGTATVRIVEGRVELVDKAARDGYTVSVQPQPPQRLVIRFDKAGAPSTIVDAMWWENRPYAEVTTVN